MARSPEAPGEASAPAASWAGLFGGPLGATARHADDEAESAEAGIGEAPFEAEPVVFHDDDDDDTVRPILECVVRHSSNSYTAYFGYKNETEQVVTIPVGPKNAFSPSPQDRNQPTTFLRGRSPHYPNAAFSVPFNGSSLTWSLRGPNSHTRTVTAKSSSSRCHAAPSPTPTPTPTATPTPQPSPTPVGTCGAPVMATRRYTRTCGDHGPTVYNQTFTLPAGSAGPYTLRVVNGDSQGRNKTSSAEVKINGVEVVRPSDFSQNVTTFTKTIATLQAANQIYVKVSSSPGSTFTLSICGANEVDVVPPSVDWIAPLEGELTSDPNPLFRVRYTDLVSAPNLASLMILVDGADQTSLFNRQPDEASLDGLISLPDGTHTLRAEIKDQAGNLGVSTRTFRVDATAPTVAVLTPAAGSVLNNARPQIRISLADAGALPTGVQPSSLEVMIDGADVTSFFTLLGGEATGQPPTPLSTGPHQIEASISDLAGNSATMSLAFSVDTVPPVITAISPLQGQILGTTDVDVALQYSDNQELNLASFQATIDGTPVPMIVDADSAAGTLSDLADGSHSLVLSIADRAGNVRTTTTSFTTDTGRPTISVVTPPNGLFLNLRNPEIRVTFSDVQGINPTTLKITVNGVDRTAEFTRAEGEAVATFVDLLPEGTNTVVAEVRDTASNLGTASSSFTLDVQPPVVTVVAPQALSYSNDPTPEIRVDMTDALSGVEPTATRIFIDETDVTTDFAIGPLGASGTLSVPLSEGLHTLRVVAADRAANPTVIDTVFHIDLTAPSLDMASPRVDGFTNDATPEIWLRTLDAASGVDPGSIRVYLLPQDATGVETDITPLLTVGAADTRGEFLLPLPDGSHRLRATARDLAGNEGEITVGFVVDTAAPLVAVDQPQSDTFLNTAEPTIVLLFSDERSGIAADLIQVKVDGVERSASLTLTPSGATLALSSALGLSLPDGPHQIEARVVDNAGNAMEAIPVTFGVDTVAPTATITSPANESFSGAAQPSWAFTVQDASPSSGVNPAFIRVLLDDIDITASATFSASGGSSGEPLVLTGNGSAPLPIAEGAHSLRITAIDNANNPVEAAVSFTVDTNAPELTSDIPESGLLIGGGAVNDGRATVTGGVSDLDPNLTLTCASPSGAGTVSLSSGAYSCSAPVTEGANSITVTAADRSGHTSAISRTLTVDRIAPVIQISDPTEGSFISSLSLSVTGTLTDASSAIGFTVTVNGQAATIVLGTAGGPATFEASGVSVGAGPTAAFEVVATDAAGNVSTATVTVRVDRNPPVVAITQPASGEYLRGGVTTVTVDVNDETATILDINGVPGTRTGCVDASAETRRCTFTAEVPLIAGNTTIVVTAFDEAGNRGVNQVSAIVDNTPPVISVTSPGSGLITNATTVSVAGTASDDSPLTLTVNGQPVTVAGGGSFSATISNDLLGVPFSGIEGAREIVFVARDAAGNESTTSVSVFFDRTPPALIVASPLQGAMIPSPSVAVAGTVSDATAVTVTVQGTPATVTGQAWSTTLADLIEGPLTITVRAIDAAGNESTVIREAEVDLGPPTVAITSPAAGTLTREGTALIAFSVLDRSATSITLNGAPVAPACPGVLACDRTQSVQLADGDNTFTVEATDAGGRTASAQVTITRDSNAPVVELLAPETASRGRLATASVSAVDNLAMASVEVRLVSAAGSTILCAGTSSCSGPIVVPEEARPGDSLTLTATATDTAGNVTNTSRTVRVTSDGVVTGTVLNDLTSLPLAGATVTLLGPNTRSSTTNEQGRYNIPVAEVSAILRIEKAGMTSVDRVVSVTSGSGTVPVDARLTPLAETTTHSPVIPATNPPLVIRPGAPAAETGTPGPVSLAAEGSQRVTLLSAQGLPNLLPPGFSPLAAFNWIPDNASAAARATVAMPTGTATLPETILVRYDTAMRDWRVVAFGLVATDGAIGVDLVGPGSYALVIPDAVGTVPELVDGSPVEGTIAIVPIPATATSEGRVDPPVLPPTGGTATGLLRIDSPTPLPSGTIVQADLEETYTLSSGEEASAPKRSIDVVAYKHSALATAWGTGDNAGTITGATTSTACAPSTPPAAGGEPVAHLCAAFPITPSRSYTNGALREGRVKLDLLAGRENARGVVGGNEAVTVVAGNVQLNVAAGSLDEDTAIALWSYDEFSPFIPITNGITPLGEVTVDFASSTLNTSAALTFRNVAAAPGDTLVVARVDRAVYDAFPRLQVVALADVVQANNESNAVTRADTGLPGLILEGIRKEGRYTLLRLAGPIGFITGSTTAGGSPVRALVTTNSLPFVATSNSSGVYAIPAVPGPVTLTARALGQSLIGTAQATAVDGTPATVNILLEGAISQATITPASGAIGVEVNDLLTLTSPVALDPAAVNATNITLRTVPAPPATGSTTVPLRFVLSGSGKHLSIIPTGPITTPPTPALTFSTTYALEVTGLLDTVGGLVTAPATTFRTKDDVKPVYNLKALTFSFPNTDGLVTVSAPAGTFPPGTEILIINSGNGVVLGLTAGNDGEVNGTLPASTQDTLIISVTDPFGNSVIYRQSQFENPATGETAIGPGGGSIDGPGGTGLDIPEGALNDGGGEWKVKLTLVPESEYPTLYPRGVLTKLLGTDLHAGHTLKMESNREAKFSSEVDVRFPLPDFTKVPVDQRPPTPQDAFYTVHRKRLVCPDGSTGCAEEDKLVIFEVIDEAKVQCKAAPTSTGPAEIPATCAPEDLEIVTASPPFAGLIGTALTTVLFLAWAYDALIPARPSRGLVRGTVRRQAYQNGTLSSVLVAGATVSGVSPDELDPVTGERKPLTYIDGGTSATTSSAGTYALWDSRYTGGPIEVVAISGETTVRSQGFEVLPGEPRFQRYQHEAVVNLTFPTEAPPPPVPDILVKLVRADNTAIDLRGIAPIGVPLQVGINSTIPGQEVAINGIEINGVPYSVRTDPDARYDYILDTPFSPSTPGAYRLTGAALRPLGEPVAFGDTFRIVAAGGGVDTDHANPPAVIHARTTPKRNARGVSVNSFVSLSFTEPVKNILSNIEFTSPTETVEYRISAVKPDGTVIPDLQAAPTTAVTSITIEPLYGLKFGTTYTVRALSGIQDLDQDATSQPAPKSLTPYETSFETFGPETINPESQDAYSTGGFVILKTEESTTGWALKHQFGGSTWNGAMLGYDASDPANLTLLSSTFVQNRAIDITGEGSTVVVASGTNHRSHPGALLVYDVTNPQAPAWVGAGTLTSGAPDGTPSRIKMKGNKVYAATWRKGIQVADVGQLRSGFAQCCSIEYFNMVRDLSQDGASFNSGAVFSTIDVVDPAAPTVKPWLKDISVIDVEGETIIAVAAAVGLVLANEGQSNVFYRGKPSFDGRTMAYAYAVETALINSRSVVLVAGIDGAGQNILIVMDISAPNNPILIGSMTLATQGKAIADIEIAGDKAYIGFDSPNAPQIEIVQIGDPANPTSAGVVLGVGGRLQVVNGILYGASYGYATEGVVGGIRTAALTTLALIDGTNPGIVVVGDGPRAAEDFMLKYRVVPSTTQVQESHIDYVVSTTTVGAPIPVTMGPGGKGEIPIPIGFTFRKMGDTVARPRLSLTTADGIEVVGPPRLLKLEQPTVELVFDDEQEDLVSADRPQVSVEVVSEEWARRAEVAADNGEQAPPARAVTFEAILPPATVSPSVHLSSDGIFETTLQASTQPNQNRLVRAKVGDVLLGETGDVAIEPGEASQATSTLTVEDSKTAIPADDLSQVILTLTAKDQHGNPVGDGTPVIWEKGEGADGEFVEAQEGTTTGQATVKYRAGVNPGPVTINVHVGEILLTTTIQQAPLGMILTAPTSRSFFNKTALPLEIQLTSSAGPVANGAKVAWFSTTGRITETQPVTGGIARASWDPTQTTWRPRVDFVVMVGQGRAQQRMNWTRTAEAADMAMQRRVRMASLAGAAPAVIQGATEPRHVAVSPAVIAGDIQGDQMVPFERADGTFEQVAVKATASYQVFGLVPGESVTVRLGTNRNPNVAPIVHFTGDEKEGTTIPDATGIHDGQATDGITLTQNGYKAGAFTFGASGINAGATAITIPDDPEFAFGGAFMVQAAVRPPPLGSGINGASPGAGVLIRKGDGFVLELVEVNGDLKARFTIKTPTGPEFLTSSLPIAREAWSLVTGKYDNGRIYVGVENALESMFVSGAPATVAGPIEIGAGLTGDLDEIRIFDLTKGALSTFGNGQQTLNFIADASGEFQAPIVATGAMSAPRVASYYRNLASGVRIASAHLNEGLLESLALQDPGASAESAIGIATIEAETYWNDTADSATTTIGFVSASTMAFFAKMGHAIIIGSGGAGDPPDLALVAGDLLGSIFLSPVTILRDVANSSERLIRGSANGQDGLDLALGVVNVGASLVKGKASALLKLGPFAKSITRAGRGSKTVARLIAVETSLAAGATGVSRIKKLVEVAGILDVVGDDDEAVGNLDTVLANAEPVPGDPTAMLQEIEGLRTDPDATPSGLKLVLAGLATPYDEGSPAADVGALVKRIKGTRKAVAGAKAAYKSLKAVVSDRAFTIVGRITRGSGTPEVANEMLEGLAELSQKVGAEGRVHVARMARRLGSASPLVRAGQRFSMRATRAIIKSATDVRVEAAQAIQIGRKTVRRFYDLIARGPDGKDVFYEMKNWVNWSRFPPRGLTSPFQYRAYRTAREQFLRDVSNLGTGAPKQLRWVFPKEFFDTHAEAVAKDFADVLNSGKARRYLSSPDNPLKYRDTIRALGGQVDAAGKLVTPVSPGAILALLQKH